MEEPLFVAYWQRLRELLRERPDLAELWHRGDEERVHMHVRHAMCRDFVADEERDRLVDRLLHPLRD